LETRVDCCQNSNGVTHARPLKKIIKAKRVEEMVLMHVWLPGITTVSGISDRRQTNIFGQGPLFK
jgi:hypothetical protein